MRLPHLWDRRAYGTASMLRGGAAPLPCSLHSCLSQRSLKFIRTEPVLAESDALRKFAKLDLNTRVSIPSWPSTAATFVGVCVCVGFISGYLFSCPTVVGCEQAALGVYHGDVEMTANGGCEAGSSVPRMRMSLACIQQVLTCELSASVRFTC
jgi:hypothetical protein